MRAYDEKIRVFRRTLLRLLYRLAENGCGDGGWCYCLLCRVMRIVQTERYRNDPKFKSSCYVLHEQVTTHTKMIDWRGGKLEFAQNCREDISAEPWWGIKMRHSKDSKPYIWWLDYCGPPQLYLTKKAASQELKALKKQYKPYQIKVVQIGEIVK